MDVRGILGAYNSLFGQQQIIALASTYRVELQGKKILQISDNTVTSVDDNGLAIDLCDIWFIPGRSYFIVGDGIFWKHQMSQSMPWKALHHGVTSYYTTAVSGNSVNDVFVSGVYGEMLHFNGVTWRSYRTDIGLLNFVFSAVALNNSFIIAVGFDGAQACIAIGKR